MIEAIVALSNLRSTAFRAFSLFIMPISMRFFVAAIFISLIGCTTISAPNRDEQESLKISKIHANLDQIKKGMTTEEVAKIMVSNAVEKVDENTIPNPYRHETINCLTDGGVCEVDYYFTEQVGEKDWESGVTLVVFKENKVIWIGKDIFAIQAKQ